MDIVRTQLPRLDLRAYDQAKRGTLGRKQPCWCGSGKRYKSCHLDADAAELRDRPKISEILREMVDIVGFQQCRSLDEAQRLVQFAALLWNATRLPDAACDGILESMLQRSGNPVEAREIAEDMMDIAYCWPHDRRVIGSAHLVAGPSGWKIVTTSIGED